VIESNSFERACRGYAGFMLTVCAGHRGAENFAVEYRRDRVPDIQCPKYVMFNLIHCFQKTFRMTVTQDKRSGENYIMRS